MIRKQGVTKHVKDCLPKEFAFHSTYPCMKILQTGREDKVVSNSSSPEYTVALDSDVAFPTFILVFLYDPSDSSYKAISSENILDHTQNYRGSFSYDSSNLYVQVENYTGADVSTHFIYFICYA